MAGSPLTYSPQILPAILRINRSAASRFMGLVDGGYPQRVQRHSPSFWVYFLVVGLCQVGLAQNTHGLWNIVIVTSLCARQC